MTTTSMFESANKFKRYALSQDTLTELDEQELARNIQENQCKTSLDKLVNTHLKLVIGIASRYSAAHAEKIDLYQEGCVGLMVAAKRFVPGVGVRFSSFASYYVKSEIQEFVISNFALVKVATTKRHRKIFFNSGKLMSLSKDKVGADEQKRLADTMKLEVTDIHEMEIRMKGYGLVTTSNDEENGSDYEFPVHIDLTDSIQEQRDAGALGTVMQKLSSQEQDVINSRWLQEKKVGLKELGMKYSISAERIRQIENAAIKKMQVMALDMAA